MTDNQNKGAKSFAEIKAAQRACLVHARNLLTSAQAVQTSGNPNIAYHLGVLTLEEIGKRALIGVQSISDKAPVPEAWPHKHTQDHVQKLFWCLFDMSFFSGKITGQSLNDLMEHAKDIHSKRTSGLYVDQIDDGVSIPADAVSVEETQALLQFAEARLNLAEAEVEQSEPNTEGADLQAWFLKMTADPQLRRQILSSGSMEKLAEFGDAKKWVEWLRELFAKEEADSRRVLEQELARSKALPATGKKNKWKLRVRIISGSHSVRPKALTAWNEMNNWMKLVSVSGKKNELIIEFLLQENVPLEGLWWFGWGLARHFVVALNIATMGFWWWRMPEQVSRYYESIEDLESKRQIVLERNPVLRVDWGKDRVLTPEDMKRLAECFLSLPGPANRDQHAPYNYYTGGLVFLSLNDIHWQCESQAVGNFWNCLKALMEEYGTIKSGEAFTPALMRFLDEHFPGMEDRDLIENVSQRYESRNFDGLVVTLKEASLMKIFCDLYFHRVVIPRQMALRKQGIEGKEKSSAASPTDEQGGQGAKTIE